MKTKTPEYKAPPHFLWSEQKKPLTTKRSGFPYPLECRPRGEEFSKGCYRTAKISYQYLKELTLVDTCSGPDSVSQKSAGPDRDSLASVHSEAPSPLDPSVDHRCKSYHPVGSHQAGFPLRVGCFRCRNRGPALLRRGPEECLDLHLDPEDCKDLCCIAHSLLPEIKFFTSITRRLV